MFGFLQRRDPLRVVASGPLPCCEVHPESGFYWAAVPKRQAHRVEFGDDVVHTFHWFVSETVRIARDDPALNRKLGRIIDILYTAREAHPDCTIFVIRPPEKSRDTRVALHARVRVVCTCVQLTIARRGTPALPGRRPDRENPALEE